MRFQAEIPNKDASLLDALVRDLDVQSNAELLTNLIALGLWMATERRQGRKLASVGPNGPNKELVLPLFERVAPAQELPHVEMEWTPQELQHLAELASAPSAPPNEKLKRLLQEP